MGRDGSVVHALAAARPQSVPKPAPATQDVLKLQATQDAVVKTVRMIEQKQKDFMQHLERMAVEVAMSATKRFVGQSIENSEADLRHLVAEGLQHFDREAHLDLYVNEHDLGQIQAADKATPTTWMNDANVQVKTDNSLPNGAFRIDSGEYELAFDWEHQIEELHLALTTALSDQGM